MSRKPTLHKFSSDCGHAVILVFDTKSSPLVPMFNGDCPKCKESCDYGPYPGSKELRQAFKEAGGMYGEVARLGDVMLAERNMRTR